MQNMLLAATLSNVNPFTYRGYCYDYDIGMYYLQSRYYDPEICRFINADSTDYLGATGTLLSYNLFAYCENDPVDYVDPSGCSTSKPKTLQAYIIKTYKKIITSFGNSNLKVSIYKNNITITAAFSITGTLATQSITKRSFYRTAFLNSVKSYWSGTYTVFGYSVTLKTNVSTKSSGIKVYMYTYTDISRVDWPRKGWKRTNPGTISLYKGDSRNGGKYRYSEFGWVSAHEFGHILGVSDAYTVNTNVVSIFNEFLTSVQNIDVEKVLKAFINNKLQGW